jgi:hypothetical protein
MTKQKLFCPICSEYSMARVTVNDCYSVFSSYGSFLSICCKKCKYYEYLDSTKFLAWNQREVNGTIFCNNFIDKSLIAYAANSDVYYYKLNMNLDLKHISLSKVIKYIVFD